MLKLKTILSSLGILILTGISTYPGNAQTAIENIPVSVESEVSTPPAACCRLNCDSVYATGIDISHYNSDPEWDNLKVDFVILKATEGSTYKDPTFKRRINICRERNIPVGAYHFFRGKEKPENEFENYYRTVGNLINLLPVVDVEKIPTGMQADVFRNKLIRYIELCKAAYGVYPVIYTNPEFYSNHIKEITASICSDCDWKIWIGETGKAYRELPLPPAIHQSGIRKVAGTKEKVDFNELYRPLKDIMLP